MDQNNNIHSVNGLPSCSTLSKSHIAPIILVEVKYRWLTTPWRIINYEATISLLALLAGASSHHYCLEKVGDSQLGCVHFPDQPCVA